MALWDKLKTELDRAGRAAQTAFDEGKVRLEILRVRQLADKAAQALGYAVFNAGRDGGTLDDETLARLSSTLAAHEAEISRLEAQMAAEKAGVSDAATSPASTPPAGETSGGEGTGSGGTGTGGMGASGTSGGTPPFSGPGSSSTASGVDPAAGDSGHSTPPHTPGF